MSLILAVEPDSLHAAQLESMARAHLRAEFVMADSADRAVAALAHRVPDIVLTASLLPGHDEEVLSRYLRALGAAAAHVQTLTIPILSPAATAPERTVLGRFRRERPRTDSHEGCDPAMFAEQIGQYLRRARQSQVEAPIPAASTAPQALPSIPAPVMTAAPPIQAMPVPTGFDEVEVIDESPIPEPLVPQLVPVVVRDVLPRYAEPAADATAEIECAGEEEVDLSGILNDLSASEVPTVAAPVLVAHAPVTPAPVAAVPVAAVPVAAVPVAPAPVAALTRVPRNAVERRRPQPVWFDDEIRKVLVPTLVPDDARADESRHRVDEDRPRVNEARPRFYEPAQHANEQPQPANVQQHMITIPSGNGGHVQASVNVSVAVAVQVSATASTGAPAPARRPSAPKPKQDEWGFFDPDQCGFRALIARLDAIAEVEEAD